MADLPDIQPVKDYFLELQSTICRELESEDESGRFIEDKWTYAGGGGGISRVLSDGAVIERGGVNFSNIKGASLPVAATARRPDLAGNDFEAVGVSLVIHPRNPYVPTSHMNVRFFLSGRDRANSAWWFGGGFDLTPYYPFKDDVVHWHRTAFEACQGFGDDVYGRFKNWCDEYFYLKHRRETRGVGGLFFDDLNQWGFDKCFSYVRSVGDSFLQAYRPILRRRKNRPHGQRERDWQLYRRGRYVEFNLVYDRGTLFGLQSGGRVESILMSMPPQAAWRYNYQPESGSPEAALLENYLGARDWLGLEQV